MSLSDECNDPAGFLARWDSEAEELKYAGPVYANADDMFDALDADRAEEERREADHDEREDRADAELAGEDPYRDDDRDDDPELVAHERDLADRYDDPGLPDGQP